MSKETDLLDRITAIVRAIEMLQDEKAEKNADFTKQIKEREKELKELVYKYENEKNGVIELPFFPEAVQVEQK